MSFRPSGPMLWLLLLAVPGCGTGGQPGTSSAPPATVSGSIQEKDLATVTLTPAAERRLGIVTVEVRRQPIPRQRTLGGEVVVPPGQVITVSAPVSGTLGVKDPASFPRPGSAVEQGTLVFTLLPLLSPERSVLTPAEQVQIAQARANLEAMIVEAGQQVELAQIQVEATGKTLARAERLLRDQAGSQRDVEEARSNSQLAIKTEETARQRLEVMERSKLDTEAGTLTPLAVTSPGRGILSKLDAVPGELVVAGASLFEVVDSDPVWIRVPVYAGQWREVKAAGTAIVTELGQRAGVGGREAKQVEAPPSANPQAATVDLYYALANPDGRLRPGQRVAVTLPLEGDAEGLVVPWSAVLHDVHGGTWVYQWLRPQTYVRRRVHVQTVNGSLGVLASGPLPGSKIVTDGAAELFGTEFGFGK